MPLRRFEHGRARVLETRFQDLRGMQVYDRHNRRLGKVSAIVVDTESNETVYAEVAPPSILGLGRRSRLVRCASLRNHPRGLRLTDTR